MTASVHGGGHFVGVFFRDDEMYLDGFVDDICDILNIDDLLTIFQALTSSRYELGFVLENALVGLTLDESFDGYG